MGGKWQDSTFRESKLSFSAITNKSVQYDSDSVTDPSDFHDALIDLRGSRRHQVQWKHVDPCLLHEQSASMAAYAWSYVDDRPSSTPAVFVPLLPATPSFLSVMATASKRTPPRLNLLHDIAACDLRVISAQYY